MCGHDWICACKPLYTGCVHVCGYGVYLCVWVHMVTRGLPWIYIFLNLLCLFETEYEICLKKTDHWDLGLINEVVWPVGPRDPVSVSLVLVLTSTCHHSWLLMWVQGNGHRTHVLILARYTLPAVPSSQHQIWKTSKLPSRNHSSIKTQF